MANKPEAPSAFEKFEPVSAPKEPVKQEVKPEQPAVKAEPAKPAVEERKAPMVILSATDAYVHERMKSQPQTIEEVDVQVPEKYQPGKHQLSLPPELEKYAGKYAFRWIFKHKKAIDRACDVRGWVLVNRMYFPELPEHYFTANGSIERGDNILAFMSFARAEAYRKTPGELSTAAIQSAFRKHEDNEYFYKPSSEDGEQVQMI